MNIASCSGPSFFVLKKIMKSEKLKQNVKYPSCILILSKQQEVRTLVQKLWVPEDRKTTVCIDSYQDGIFQGRFYGPDGEEQCFGSLAQFLVMMEQRLELTNIPQADTAHRSFSALLPHTATGSHRSSICKGAKATFELQILFRQHTSWQGVILWREQHREQSFRSVLELVLLMDSALRGEEGREAS